MPVIRDTNGLVVSVVPEWQSGSVMIDMGISTRELHLTLKEARELITALSVQIEEIEQFQARQR